MFGKAYELVMALRVMNHKTQVFHTGNPELEANYANYFA